LSGLPGKIAKGSGWHPFTLTVKNPTKDDVPEIDMFPGVGPADPNAENAFSAKQVVLQEYNEHTKHWEGITDGDGHSVGYVGSTDLPKQTYAKIKMRLNVTSSAPVGKGLTIGAGIYLDKANNCLAATQVSYKIDIVAPGTSTNGSKPQPQTGGKAPMPKSAPTGGSGNQIAPTGSLAETGSSSALPLIAGLGGAAVVAGAGAMFVVRRRKAGSGVV
jgi:LPXTG-motif cell wall-anchored protein